MSARSTLEWSPGAAGPLLAANPDANWRDAALCAQADPEQWFPPKGGRTASAKQVCRSCPVQAECLEYALENEIRHGVWGGMSEQQRRRILRDRARQARQQNVPRDRAGAAQAA